MTIRRHEVSLNRGKSVRIYQHTIDILGQKLNEQECIPVGCAPSAAVAVSLEGGVYYPGRCLPDHTLWTESQTGVKTFPCRNYVADGKNVILQLVWIFLWSQPTKLWEGNVFSRVCLLTAGWGCDPHRTCSNLFSVKHVRSASERFVSCWNAFIPCSTSPNFLPQHLLIGTFQVCCCHCSLCNNRINSHHSNA